LIAGFGNRNYPNGYPMNSVSSKSKTILFVHNNNDLYGAEVILLELLKGLDRRSFHPIVVLPKDTKHINRLSARLEQEGIEYQFIGMAVIRRKYFHLFGVLRYIRDLLLGVFRLVSLIRRREVALIHSNTIAVLCGAVAAWITRTPHVWHIHEIIVEPVPARKAMHFLVCHLSDAVVAVSGAVRDHIARDNSKCVAKMKVIHNGIDLAQFSREPSGSKIRAEYGVPSDAVLVGMVGKVCRWKGQLQFVEAAKVVSEERFDVHFLAVGGVFDDETYYMEQFRKTVKSSGLQWKFTISDFRTDIPNILHALDIFVLPSTQPDPFPTVILEAMAAGKAVIATAHGGPAEIVVDGETGYLVAPNDHRALATAILSLAEDPSRLKAMGAAGRRRVERCFGVDRFVADFEALYTRILPSVMPTPPRFVQVSS
jgi:glycosyltransferase involved in cell wall biosynthesis